MAKKRMLEKLNKEMTNSKASTQSIQCDKSIPSDAIKVLIDAVETIENLPNRKRKADGYDRVKNSKGDVYEGDFINYKKNGKGKIISIDGIVYEGDWKDDLIHGIGKFTDNNGNMYEGEFQDDNKL